MINSPDDPRAQSGRFPYEMIISTIEDPPPKTHRGFLTPKDNTTHPTDPGFPVSPSRDGSRGRSIGGTLMSESGSRCIYTLFTNFSKVNFSVGNKIYGCKEVGRNGGLKRVIGVYPSL